MIVVLICGGEQEGRVGDQDDAGQSDDNEDSVQGRERLFQDDASKHICIDGITKQNGNRISQRNGDQRGVGQRTSAQAQESSNDQQIISATIIGRERSFSIGEIEEVDDGREIGSIRGGGGRG